jgi:FtsZ-interacting cell division protein ZipA
MEIIIALAAIVVIGAIWYANRNTGADVNGDGKVDLADVKAAVEKTVATVADANKDGKVDVADVKAVATKAKAAAKKTVAKTATKAKAAVKKAATKAASKRGPKPKQV